VEIAKMFASLGFKIDMAALSSFDAGIRKSKGELANFSRGVNEAARKTNVLINRLASLNRGFDISKVATATKEIRANAKAYRKAVSDTVSTVGKFETKLESLMLTLTRTDNHLLNGMSNMLAYSSSVLHARTSVEALVLQIRALRTLGGGRASINLNQGGHGGSRTGSGQPPINNQSSGGSAAAGMAAGGMIQRFLRPTLGAGIVSGGALTAGYALKEIVESGREYQRMATKLQAVSRSAAEFKTNLEYVQQTSQKLGASTVEFGNAYAGIFETTKNSQGVENTRKAYTGFMEFFKVMQMSPEETKGALRAIQQMFNKGKIMA
jgi:hypothetical protein